ncbi:hypothetical protein EJ07DRAFT_130358 [Lizonia empirigonia]|nr:hypothetical protein EJ07DRAFT_130358 [Lizonia empirigonia]
MRYDNWDIILFPEDSNIPIQEYKTACYFSHDEAGHELPTLRTYIGSLKPDTPFRISVHHWGVPKPSPLIQEAQRRAGKRMTFTVQVIIDDDRPYHGSFEVNATSPQDIAHEQRLFKSHKSNEPSTSQPKQRLLFPKNHKESLLQSSTWHPRGADNRIKIILSERLVDEDDKLDVGCWDIVCFSFQHAPRELLEQAGIAYPIVDPLRSLIGERATFVSQSFPRNTMGQELLRGSRIYSELSPDPDSEHVRPANPEPHQRSTTRMPSASEYPGAPPFMGHRGGSHAGIWNNSWVQHGDPDDDISMASWPSRRYGSNMSGMESCYDPSYFPYAAQPWAHQAALPKQSTGPYPSGNLPRRDKSAHQVLMTWRDDQFGQILDAISPSKKHRDVSRSLPAQRSTQDTHQTTTQPHRPPKMGALSVPVRPSSTAIARTTSYPDFNAALRNISKRPSDQSNSIPNASLRSNPQAIHAAGKKEKRNASQSRIPTPHSLATHMPTPNPFMLGVQCWDSDVSMRDSSSNFSSLSRLERDPAKAGNKIGSAHAPSTLGNVKSRKEGLSNESELPGIEIRHDESLLPSLGAKSTIKATLVADDSDRDPRNKPSETPASVPRHVEVIDVDAIDPNLVADTTADLARLSPFKAGHKSGTSSISSTGRLERQLYSALGEELGNFEQQIDANGMGDELAQALSGTTMHSNPSGPTVGEFELVGKRKRQGTMGEGRDKSPLKKKDRARQAMVEDEEIPVDMPRLRGD